MNQPISTKTRPGDSTNYPGLSKFGDLTAKELYSRGIVLVLAMGAILISSFCLVNAVKMVNHPFPGFLINERLVVTQVGRPHWTGLENGIKSPDKVIEANNQPINSDADLDQVINTTKIGDSVSYIFERRGTRIEVSLPTMMFTWADLLITGGLQFFAGLVYFSIGFIVYVLKPDTKVTWVFLGLGYTLGFYSVTGFDISSSHYFIATNIFVSCFIGAFGLHLSLIFPSQRAFLDKFPSCQIIPYLLALAIGLPVVIFYPHPPFKTFYALSRAYLILSALSVVSTAILAFFHEGSILAKQRAKVILLGAAIGFPIPAIGNQIKSLMGVPGEIQILVSFLNLPLLVFPLSISYAIAKHNLFDVDVFVKRAVGYGLMTLVVGLGYFSVQTVVQNFILEPMFGEFSEQVYPIIFALLIVFLFNPTYRAVQDFIDQVFFRKKYDYKSTVTSVSDALTSLLDQKAIVQRLIETLRGVMFIDRAGVLLMDQKGAISMFSSEDSPNPPSKATSEKPVPQMDKDPLVDLIAQEKILITKYDIEEEGKYQDWRKACSARFEELGASLAVPLIHKDEVKGVLTLGQKMSGHFYTREDIELIQTLANQGAVAIENAKLADQMKKEETTRTNLARYLSPQIVDQVINHNVEVNLGGARKTVTILFSDIRNFTTMSETWPPDQLIKILNEYFTEMANIIFTNQGSLDKYIGDAIVAVFGSLVPLDMPGQHAAIAAIEMMEAMPRLNQKWEKEYGFSMQIGIGISTGEVFLGNVGSPERMEFTVIGDAVNVASRFSGLAKSGQILVTRETLPLMDNGITVNQLPDSTVKGKSAKMQVFEIAHSVSLVENKAG